MTASSQCISIYVI